MKINKADIFNTIQKMVAAGKSLPQRDRIRYAKDQAEEERKVLEQTVNLWWDIFGKQDIGAEMWMNATDRALVISGIPKLETSIINPALMSVALAQCEKEYLEAQQVKHEQQKKNERYADAYPFPEMGKLIAYHMLHHKQPLLSLPDPDVIRTLVGQKWQPDTIEKNMIKLRVYYCFAQHAKRDGMKMPVRLVVNGDRSVSIQFVD